YIRGDWKHWVDYDKDGQNTRIEALIEESESVQLDSKGRIISGVWYDPYSGAMITNTSKIDVDHLVPLGNANDLSNPERLIADSIRENRAKGDKSSPDQRMPSNKAFHCLYVLAWQSIKLRWNLLMTESESKFIVNKIKECGL
ncbi:MAG: hypothetical protein QXU40_04125, partial [Candidatus Pacearchaeota archaeon]